MRERAERESSEQELRVQPGKKAAADAEQRCREGGRLPADMASSHGITATAALSG
jgi:hypothetical protein